MSPGIDFATAISNAETGKNTYVSAVNQQVTDQTVVDGIQTKLDAAKTIVAGDVTAISTAASAYKQNLTDLAAAVQAEIDSLTALPAAGVPPAPPVPAPVPTSSSVS